MALSNKHMFLFYFKRSIDSSTQKLSQNPMQPSHNYDLSNVNIFSISFQSFKKFPFQVVSFGVVSGVTSSFTSHICWLRIGAILWHVTGEGRMQDVTVLTVSTGPPVTSFITRDTHTGTGTCLQIISELERSVLFLSETLFKVWRNI